MPQLMSYENVVPLNRETHRNLRLERAEGDSGEPLFDADGKETPFLRDTIAFLQSFLTEMERTEAFMKRLCGHHNDLRFGYARR